MTAKIIIDSKFLYSKIKGYDFTYTSLHSASYSNGILQLNIGEMTHEFISCHSDTANWHINQTDARWDWIQKIIKKISPTPIVLRLKDNKCRIIIDC